MAVSRSPLLPALGLLAAFGALSACSSTPPAQVTGGNQPARPGSGQCNADAVKWAIGQENNQANFDRIWKESGAGLIRPISPNQAVTMDFREDRINLHLDANNRITRISCG